MCIKLQTKKCAPLGCGIYQTLIKDIPKKDHVDALVREGMKDVVQNSRTGRRGAAVGVLQKCSQTEQETPKRPAKRPRIPLRSMNMT